MREQWIPNEFVKFREGVRLINGPVSPSFLLLLLLGCTWVLEASLIRKEIGYSGG